jgi:hypothetical protein
LRTRSAREPSTPASSGTSRASAALARLDPLARRGANHPAGVADPRGGRGHHGLRGSGARARRGRRPLPRAVCDRSTVDQRRKPTAGPLPSRKRWTRATPSSSGSFPRSWSRAAAADRGLRRGRLCSP